MTLELNKDSKSKRSSLLIFIMIIAFFAYLVDKNVELPSAVLFALAGIAFIVLLFKLNKPEVSLYALALYLPFSKILVGDFGGSATALNFTNVLTIIALASWIAIVVTKHKKFYTKTPIDILLFVFMFLGCLSLVKGILYFGTLYATEFIFPLKRWLTPMILFFMFFNMVQDKKTIKNITIIIMTVMTIVALMAIKDYMNIGEVSSLDKSRVEGITEQPNILAAFFVYYMFLFAGFFMVYWRNIKYWLLFLPFLACFRGIQVTFSRGGYLAFAAAALTIAFFKNKIIFLALIFVLMLAVLNPVLLPKGIQYRMSSTFRDDAVFATDVEDVVDKSSQRRIEAWKGGFKMIKEHPLFGIGYGLFPFVIPRYAPVRRMDAHNTYILIAAEMGIPALVVFLLLLFLILLNTWKLYRKTKDPFIKALALGFLGGLGGVFVANMFGGRLDSQEMSSYFWILAALVFKALQLEKNEANDKKKLDKKLKIKTI